MFLKVTVTANLFKRHIDSGFRPHRRQEYGNHVNHEMDSPNNIIYQVT